MKSVGVNDVFSVAYEETVSPLPRSSETPIYKLFPTLNKELELISVVLVIEEVVNFTFDVYVPEEAYFNITGPVNPEPVT